MSSAIVTADPRSTWPSMFEGTPCDVDEVISPFLDEKDLRVLRVLEVCKRWRDNPCLIELKNRCITEWRKDQAVMAHLHAWPILLLRKYHISLWDVPFHLHNGDLTHGEEGMPKINGIPCSIAQYKTGIGEMDLGLVFALQSKKKNLS